MPLYEYKCRACGTVKDIRHGFDEAMSETCVACGGELARLISAAGIVFKGSGFYKTDSRGKAPSESGASGDASKTDVAANGEPAKNDAPKSDAPKSDAAKSDAPKSDAAKSDGPKTDSKSDAKPAKTSDSTAA